MQKNISILLIEDSFEDCELILMEFKKNNYQVSYLRVEEEESLRKALENKWDVILSEYTLSKFNGAESLKICKKWDKDVPFILITGAVDEELSVDLMRNGANDVVLKDRLYRLVPSIEREITHYQNQKVSMEQVRYLQKLEAMGLLATGIAHDFNNFLAAMVLYFTLLKKSQEETTRNYAEKLLQVHAKATSLVKQILAFSRKQPSIKSHLNLNSSIEEMSDLLSRLLTSRVVIHTHLDPQLGYISAVKSQIDQVLMNLCLNAKGAMTGAGDLTITTKHSRIEKAETVTSGELAVGDYVVLSIQDTGAGMNPELMEHIFEPFFTAKSSENDSALGLSIVHGIVKSMRGEIQVSSLINQGTIYTVYFPRSYDK